jgi:cyclase
MKLEKISKSVYANTEPNTGGNVGIIVLGNKVVAIDSKYPVSGTDFRRSIPSVTSKPVTHLLLTHSHGDHIFGIQAFHDCTVVAQKLVWEKMNRNLSTIWSPSKLERMIEDIKKNTPAMAPQYNGLKIVLPNKTFENTFSIDGVKMTHMPGHTDDSATVYYTDDRTFFSGDLIFSKSFPWAGDPTADPDAWISSFRKILKMDVDRIVPGHGPICDKNEVEAQLRWFEAMSKEMKKLIKEGGTEDEVAKYQGYPQLYETDRPEWRMDSLRHWYRIWAAKK